MNLAKHDPETEMEMNMTPMIDVVFLLIIFFMIITDLTQKDLEELELPVALHAVPDKPDPGEWRPIVNIPYDGSMIVSQDSKYEPERDDGKDDPYRDMKVWLSDASKRMQPEHFSSEGEEAGPCGCSQAYKERKAMPHDKGSGQLIPGDFLLIRADQSTSFKHIQKVMEFCGDQGVQIWKIQLAAAEPEAEVREQAEQSRP